VPDAQAAVLVLATGDEDGMNSPSRAKVLHGFAGRTLLDHVLAAVSPPSTATAVVLVGERGDQVIEHLSKHAPQVVAVADPAQAVAALPKAGSVLVVPGDAPLIAPEQLIGLALDVAFFRTLPPVSSWREFVQAVPDTDVDLTALDAARVHDRVQLAAAHHAYNARLLEAHMRAGVTIVDPSTTWVDADVRLEPDVTLWPSVELRGKTTVGAGASIGPDVSLTDTTVGAGARLTRAVAVEARVGAGATVGPFAYLRPGTDLADGVHIGTYVELKKATVGEGTKIPHLTYVGDATIGEHTNIGAATVFVNYDGVEKHHTVIGSHVRTGADNMFVAPVEVGDGAYTAAGSVITEDVPPGALGVARAAQRNVAGWVARRRPGTPAAEAAARAVERQED
jgi:bifunctional N-acetylglucosamine-1-phosphate-uridyltransferase/glucosamine-1-phosphate-acetyltransferase GlmU-like protein